MQKSTQHPQQNRNNTLEHNSEVFVEFPSEINVELSHQHENSISLNSFPNRLESNENFQEGTYEIPSNLSTEVYHTYTKHNTANVVNTVNANDNFENNIDTFTNFKNLLRQCCLDYNINTVQTTALLRVTRVHRCFRDLPKNHRTLLKTGRTKINLLPLGKGVYWHIGFVRSCQRHLLLYENLPPILEFELNTDGLSLSLSNPSQFWPIQLEFLIFRILSL